MVNRSWAKRSHQASVSRRVWRITAQCPQGEYVDPHQATVRVSGPPSKSASAFWTESSSELMAGVEITEIKI